MNKYISIILVALVYSACSPITDSGINSKNSPDNNNNQFKQKNSTKTLNSSDQWVTAYLASYNHYAPPGGNWGNLPTDGIDWSAFTHLNYFAIHAKADGSLTEIKAYKNMNPDRINAIVDAAHQHNKPVLITIGGWGNHEGFSGAIQSGSRATFINNLVSLIDKWGFDGIDLDMEPIKDSDVSNYKALVKELHNALQNETTPLLDRPLLAAATNMQPQMFADLQDKFDQINLMTYDYSGAWQGWVTWHNSPIYNDGQQFPNVNRTLPSIDKSVNNFIDAGVNKTKLGIGIDFYGYVWDGVSEPTESWTTAPTVTDNVPYHKIMNQYYNADNVKWDPVAQAAYISIDNGSEKKFISYDNTKSIRAKAEYIRQKGLGGGILWELSGGYRQDQPSGERDKLLQSVKEAFSSSTSTPVDSESPTVQFSTPTGGATVSGTTSLAVSAQDNNEVSKVVYKVGGNSIGSSSSPTTFSFDWNTTSLNNGSYSLSATAYDAAGNKASTSINVTVSNSTSGSEPVSSSADPVYDDQLQDPWINTSYNANVDYRSSTQLYEGSNAIKVVQNSWGALSFRYGNWGSSKALNTTDYDSLTFYVYSVQSDANFSVHFANDNKDSFNKIKTKTVANGSWTRVAIPMSKLNPNNYEVQRVTVMELSGTQKTYYVDGVTLGGNSSGSGDSGSGGSDGGSDGGSTDDPTDSTILTDIFSESLVTPWIDVSWNANIDWQHTNNTYEASTAIKVSQNAWGALSIHYDNWGSSETLSTDSNSRLTFRVYMENQQGKFNVNLANDKQGSFGKVSTQSLESNTWTKVTIPLSDLNPSNEPVQRLTLMETSGENRNYYIDNLRIEQ